MATLMVIHPQFMIGCNAGPPAVKLESLNDASVSSWESKVPPPNK